MTPFGERLRELRSKKGVTQKQMAASLGVSSAYLSALERGHRGKPSWDMLQRITGYFNIIWDEAEDLRRLADISDPRVVVDTNNLTPEATRLANLLARNIVHLSPDEIKAILKVLESGNRPKKALGKDL